MDNGDPKANPQSSCEIAGDGFVNAINGGYFFAGGEFGWNIVDDFTGDFAGLDPIESELIGSNGDDCASAHRSEGISPSEEKMKVLAPNMSVSSSSSEDLAEKSTASGSSAVKTTSETPSKAKSKGPNRVRQQRIAFVTKTEIDHLEDGYRWRKYGQKAVKNSPFPRSYYRCTNSKCMVKKRIERSYEDPSVVITTYEGQHNHHSVGFPKGELIPVENPSGNHFNPSNSQFYNHPRIQYPQQNSLHITQLPPNRQKEDGEYYYSIREVGLEYPVGEGLLGDIVSPGIRN